MRGCEATFHTFEPSNAFVSLDGTVAGSTKQIKCSRTCTVWFRPKKSSFYGWKDWAHDYVITCVITGTSANTIPNRGVK